MLKTTVEEQMEFNYKEKKEWESKQKRKLELLQQRINSQTKRLKLSVKKFLEEITTYEAELQQVSEEYKDTQSQTLESAINLAVDHEKKILRSIKDAAKATVKRQTL